MEIYINIGYSLLLRECSICIWAVVFSRISMMNLLHTYLYAVTYFVSYWPSPDPVDRGFVLGSVAGSGGFQPAKMKGDKHQLTLYLFKILSISYF